MHMTRPKGESITPEQVNWIDGADEQDEEFSSISSETMIYRFIESNSKAGFLTSARMIRETTGLGRTSIRYNLNFMLEKELIFRKFGIAQSGDSKTILPFYVTDKHKNLLVSIRDTLEKMKKKERK